MESMTYRELDKNPKAEDKIKSIDNTRSRVNALRESDNKYQDSIYELAAEEDIFRQELMNDDITGDVAGRIADRYSTKAMEKMEAEKVKWIDNLTNLPNKNAFIEEARKYLALEKRMGNKSSFLMIDFDHFKSVNDVYGHSAGDDALRRISQIIKDVMRDSDLIYRFGGEEFVAFLPNTDSHSALVLAERIRAAVESADIVVKDNEGQEVTLKKTVSVGCVGTDQITQEDAETTDLYRERIMNYADRAMYASKNGGRNRVTLFHDELEDAVPKK
jgi:diguanylate cyclase (GGDEF)-like protein